MRGSVSASRHLSKEQKKWVRPAMPAARLSRLWYHGWQLLHRRARVTHVRKGSNGRARPVASTVARHSHVPAIRFTRVQISRLPRFAHSLRPARLLGALYESDWFSSQRRLLHPGFQRLGPVPATGYDYSIDWTPAGGNLHPVEWQLASLHVLPIADGSAATRQTFWVTRADVSSCNNSGAPKNWFGTATARNASFEVA
jgi:hypothetical protein